MAWAELAGLENISLLYKVGSSPKNLSLVFVVVSVCVGFWFGLCFYFVVLGMGPENKKTGKAAFRHRLTLESSSPGSKTHSLLHVCIVLRILRGQQAYMLALCLFFH